MKYLKNLGIIIGLMLILSMIVTLLSYFNIFNLKVLSIFKLIIPLISLFIGSFRLGKITKSKGYLEGIKIGLIFILFIFLINILLLKNLSLKILIYYVIILVTSIIASMLGITKNKTN